MHTVARGGRLPETHPLEASRRPSRRFSRPPGYPEHPRDRRPDRVPAARRRRPRLSRRNQARARRNARHRGRSRARHHRPWRFARRGAAPQPGVRRDDEFRRQAVPHRHRLARTDSACRSYLRPKRSRATSTARSREHGSPAFVVMQVRRASRGRARARFARRVDRARRSSAVWRRAKLVVLDLSTGDRIVVQPRFTGALLIDSGHLPDDERRYSTIAIRARRRSRSSTTATFAGSARSR